MAASKTDHRLPRSIRKYVRDRKALYRRTLGPAEAKRAIDQLMRSIHRGATAPRTEAPAAGTKREGAPSGS